MTLGMTIILPDLIGRFDGILDLFCEGLGVLAVTSGPPLRWSKTFGLGDPDHYGYDGEVLAVRQKGAGADQSKSQVKSRTDTDSDMRQRAKPVR